MRAARQLPTSMSQRTERVDELLRQEIGAIVASGGRGSADRVRDDHGGRDDAGPAPREGLGERHRPAGRARRRARGVCATRCRSSATSSARRLRIRRIPDLHVQLDDTAERGTRILQLLAELETGSVPDAGRRPSTESLPTPVARLHHARRPRPRSRRRPSAARPAAAARPPCRAPAGIGPQAVRPRAAQGRRGDGRPRPVPRRRPAGRRRSACAAPGACSRSATRTPTRTRSGRRSGSSGSSRRSAARADPVCTDPVPPLYDFLDGVERFRTDPDPTAPYDLLVISDCGSLERIGEVARPARRAVRPPAAGHHRPPRLERRRRGRRLDRPARGRDVRDGRPPRQPARASRSTPAAARWRPP